MSLAGMNGKPDEPDRILVEYSGRIEDVDLRADAAELVDHVTCSDLTERFMNFTKKHPAAVNRAWQFYNKHPLLCKAAAASVGMGALVRPVAADEVFGINTTEIDAAFDLMNQHIIPNTGDTISAMPAVIIPLVILIVLIMILFIVPELMGTMIDAVRSAISGAFHKSK